MLSFSRPVVTLTLQRLAILAILIAVPGMSVAGQSTAPTDDDHRAVQDCLEAARVDRLHAMRCIGVASEACQHDPQMGSTKGLTDCARREMAVWDDMLNSHYQELREKLSRTGKLSLRNIQREWIQWRDVKCELPYSLFEGGSIASPMAADCLMQATGLRAIELGQALDSVSN